MEHGEGLQHAEPGRTVACFSSSQQSSLPIPYLHQRHKNQRVVVVGRADRATPVLPPQDQQSFLGVLGFPKNRCTCIRRIMKARMCSVLRRACRRPQKAARHILQGHQRPVRRVAWLRLLILKRRATLVQRLVGGGCRKMGIGNTGSRGNRGGLRLPCSFGRK